MCVGFLHIVSFVDTSLSMCMQRSRNGSFWSFSGSVVNLMCGSMLLICSVNSSMSYA